jgi:hypothetical protein
MLVATPLILVDLALLLLTTFLMSWAFYVIVPAFPSYWPLSIAIAISAALYVAGLTFIAADALETGVRALRSPGRVLRCSLLGLGMNAAGAVLGFVAIFAALLFVGAIF